LTNTNMWIDMDQSQYCENSRVIIFGVFFSVFSDGMDSCEILFQYYRFAN